MRLKVRGERLGLSSGAFLEKKGKGEVFAQRLVRK